jgi:hypothetical protein
MDIMEKLEDLVEKIKEDKSIAAKFKKDPIDTVQDLLGIKLPEEQLEKLVDAIKSKIKLDNLDDVLEDKLEALGKKALGGLFGKK